MVIRFAVKPTSSILIKRNTVDLRKVKTHQLKTKGRHDPCVGIKRQPIGEAMVAMVLADLKLLQKKNK